MKIVSVVCGVLGILVAIVAFIGRFHGPPTVTIFGIHSAATHVLVIANSLLLIGIFLGQLRPPDKKS